MKVTDATILGILIQRRRSVLGLSQDELSAHVEISQATLSRIEAGMHALNYDVAMAIARRLKLGTGFMEDVALMLVRVRAVLDVLPRRLTWVQFEALPDDAVLGLLRFVVATF